jgi:hypothetical protein
VQNLRNFLQIWKNVILSGQNGDFKYKFNDHKDVADKTKFPILSARPRQKRLWATVVTDQYNRAKNNIFNLFNYVFFSKIFNRLKIFCAKIWQDVFAKCHRVVTGKILGRTERCLCYPSDNRFTGFLSVAYQRKWVKNRELKIWPVLSGCPTVHKKIFRVRLENFPGVSL